MAIKDTVSEPDGTVTEYEAELYPASGYHPKPHYRVLVPVESEEEAKQLADKGYQLRMRKAGSGQVNVRSLSKKS